MKTSHFSLWQCAVPLALAFSALACAEVDPAAPGGESAPLLERARPADSPFSLCCGKRTTLVDGILSAENLFITSDERLLVSGDDGVYQVLRNPEGTMRAERVASAPDCRFGGITEARGTVYVNCYADPDSHVYASPLQGPGFAFRPVANLTGVFVANGLTSDEAGHLYVACTGQDQIMRLTLSDRDPLTLSAPQVWLSGSGLLTNGMKYYASALYWTDGLTVKTAPIRADGRPGRVRTLAVRITLFDDLAVDADGILVADWLGYALRAYGASGVETGSTTEFFDSPSAVLRAKGRLGFSERALLVTEKGRDRLALFEPR